MCMLTLASYSWAPQGLDCTRALHAQLGSVQLLCCSVAGMAAAGQLRETANLGHQCVFRYRCSLCRCRLSCCISVLMHLLQATTEHSHLREQWAAWNPQRAAAQDLQHCIEAGEVSYEDTVQAAVQHKGEVLPGTVSPQEATRRGWYAHTGPFKWPAPKAVQVGGNQNAITVMRHDGGTAGLWCSPQGAALSHNTGSSACAWLRLLRQRFGGTGRFAAPGH